MAQIYYSWAFKEKNKDLKKKKRKKKSVLTLSLARNVKNLGNSLCIKEGRKMCQSFIDTTESLGDKHRVEKQSSI